jgi:hypothetical protein
MELKGKRIFISHFQSTTERGKTQGRTSRTGQNRAEHREGQGRTYSRTGKKDYPVTLSVTFSRVKNMTSKL